MLSFLLKLLISIVAFVAGFICMKYSFAITRLFGHQEWAERYLGEGGTYGMWKLIGIILMAGGLWYLFS